MYQDCPTYSARNISRASTLVIALALVVFATLLSTTCSHAVVIPAKAGASQRLTAIIEDNYHPYSFINEQGKPDGFSVEITRAVAKAMDLEIDIRAGNWDVAMKDLETGLIDLVPIMASSPERQKLFSFSVPYTVVYDAIFFKKGTTGVHSLKDLSGKKVIVTNNDLAHNYLLLSGLSKTMTIVFSESGPDALKQLAAGTGDVAIMPKLIGLVTVKKQKLAGIETSPLLIDSYTRSWSFGVKADNQALLERLNQGLNIIKNSGEYDAIYKKWFGDLEGSRFNVKKAVRYGSGAILGFLGIIAWNVMLKRQVKAKTEDLKSEIEQRKQAEAELRTSQEDLYRAQQVGQIGSWRLNIQRNELIWSDENYRIFGVPKGEPLTYESFLDAVHPDDRLYVDTSWQAALRGEPYDIEHRMLVEREVKWVREKAYLEFDATGALLGGFGITQLITERRQADEEKANLESQLHQAQKMESVGRLAGGVAHDFNNLLTVILGHAELAMMKMNPSEPIVADLAEIRRAAERSAALTNQLLAFARKQTVAPKVLDLNAIVGDMTKMLVRLIGEDIHLVWQPAETLWLVKIDPSQIDQILANLCVNARDAIEDVGKITIEARNSIFDDKYCSEHPGYTPGEYVMLAVSDNGCGMDRETLTHAFEPFFTTKALGQGTGLGLATVYGIVRQNNGFINIYSEPGEGTTFRIYLPRHDDGSGPTKTETNVKPLERGKETILLVEDELSILNLTRQMLELQGYNVLPANNPAEAIKQAEQFTGEIHLLMTDVVMPGMNGRDLSRQLLSLRPKIKCLFSSGYTANVIAHHGVLDADVHFIAKPFSLPELAEKVRKALDDA